MLFQRFERKVYLAGNDPVLVDNVVEPEKLEACQCRATGKRIAGIGMGMEKTARDVRIIKGTVYPVCRHDER